MALHKGLNATTLSSLLGHETHIYRRVEDLCTDFHIIVPGDAKVEQVTSILNLLCLAVFDSSVQAVVSCGATIKSVLNHHGSRVVCFSIPEMIFDMRDMLRKVDDY